MNYILGLTGGIATGKSHLSGVLGSLGARVVDADRISRELTAPGGAALPLIRDSFGDGYVRDGVLDRKALGRLVFGDADALTRLNGITHPLIFEEMHRQIGDAELEGIPVVILDVPLLYETGLDVLCDEVWCAWVPRAVQLSRLMVRDGLTRVEAGDRIRSQMSAWEKRRRADRFIDTRGTMEESAGKVIKMYGELMERLAAEQSDAQNS